VSEPAATSALDARIDETGRYRIVRLRDQWYVACRSAVLRKRPIALRIFSTPLVLFRSATGRASALLDRCAHRNVPLSLGSVEGERIACRYHGWQFDGQGVCRLVPALGGPQEARSRRVPSFPVVERDGFVWVWPDAGTEPSGEPYRFPYLDDPSYRTFRIDYRVEGTLHAVLENMLDVPHTGFLHRGLFRSGARNRITAVVRRFERGVEAQYVGEPRPSGLAARILGIGAASGGPTVGGSETGSEPAIVGGADPAHGNGAASATHDDELAHFDRFFLPSISQVEYRLGRSHFVATSALTPESDFATRFSTVIAYRLPLPGWLLRLAFEPVARSIFAQDAWIVAKQTQAVRAFGEEAYASTAVDVLGPEIWRLLKLAAERELRVPDAADAEHRVDLLV
jgi:phenylpropionate dioxygenase-like ring-hydroxylating dioxygenase large terminal subunit